MAAVNATRQCTINSFWLVPGSAPPWPSGPVGGGIWPPVFWLNPRLHPSLAERTSRGWNLDTGILARSPAPSLRGPQGQSGMEFGHRLTVNTLWGRRLLGVGSGRRVIAGDRLKKMADSTECEKKVLNLKFSILFYSKYYSTECEMRQHRVRTMLVMRRRMLLTSPQKEKPE